MRITILNGEPDPSSVFQEYVRDFADDLASMRHQVTILDLRRLNLQGCSGCWGCWVKTPGECVKRDDSAEVCRAVLNSDLTVLASPMLMGFTSELLKRATDQMIALVHPYFTLEGDEIHHRSRYSSCPDLGLLIRTGSDTDAEDLEITKAIWVRTAHNLKFRFAFLAVADRPPQEIANEITAVA
jgi:hypothetical protein